jgi:cytosine/adenosine deaminase-related metal-dependent hydrolase
VDNVHGETIGADGQVEPVIGLLFDRSGVIRQVFHPGDKLPRKGFGYHVDGQGQVILPGLIDAHVHVMELGLSALTLDLSATRSLPRRSTQSAPMPLPIPIAPGSPGAAGTRSNGA